VDVEFTLLFFLFIAIAAFIAKRMIAQGVQSPTIEDIVSEIAPILNDPAALHRKVTRDLSYKRIHGKGVIADIETSPETVTIRVRDRVAAESAGAASQRDVVFELAFMRPDEPDEAGVNQYVEFTGILIDITAGGGTPVLTVEPGEILYIGDGPPDAAGFDDEDPPDTTAEFR
jgi:hypothetical protein